MADKSKGDVLQGTLDMLVLKSLQLGPMHGWGITERLDTGSERVLQVGQGSLYPALYRLERQGYIASEWGVTENNRQARFYKLTPAGRKLSPKSARRGRDYRAQWISYFRWGRGRRARRSQWCSSVVGLSLAAVRSSSGSMPRCAFTSRC